MEVLRAIGGFDPK